MNRTHAALLLWVLCGCDRTHMSAHFGEATRAAFRAQVLDPDAGVAAKPNPPLDPEEAAAVARSHNRSLSPQAAGGGPYRDPVLVVPSSAPGAGPGSPEASP